jgi:hypothetical protein
MATADQETMTPQSAEPARRPRRLRSTAAIFSGFVAVVVLSLGTDQIMHLLGVYPPWDKPMHDTGLLVLALSYRMIYTAIGGFIAAWLAPEAPMRHAVILGLIGLVPGGAGVIAGAAMDLGPLWYPIALALTGLPCCCLGGVLHCVAAGR